MISRFMKSYVKIKLIYIFIKISLAVHEPANYFQTFKITKRSTEEFF